LKSKVLRHYRIRKTSARVISVLNN
jgi:hypothetical protein